MIHVLATIRLNPGTRDQFLADFREVMPSVLAENGCLAYGPAIDATTDLPQQQRLGGDALMVVEQWDSVEALQLITQEIEALHGRDDIKLEQRFRALDLLDGASRTHEHALLLEYLATPRHKKSNEQRLWSSAYGFWQVLGGEYQRCFHEARKSGAAARATLPTFVGRALRALRQQLRCSLLRY